MVISVTKKTSLFKTYSLASNEKSKNKNIIGLHDLIINSISVLRIQHKPQIYYGALHAVRQACCLSVTSDLFLQFKNKQKKIQI